MPIRFQCPTCGKQYSQPEQAAGSRCRCGQCQTAFVVPWPAGPNAAAPGAKPIPVKPASSHPPAATSPVASRPVVLAPPAAPPVSRPAQLPRPAQPQPVRPIPLERTSAGQPAAISSELDALLGAANLPAHELAGGPFRTAPPVRRNRMQVPPAVIWSLAGVAGMMIAVLVFWQIFSGEQESPETGLATAEINTPANGQSAPQPSAPLPSAPLPSAPSPSARLPGASSPTVAASSASESELERCVQSATGAWRDLANTLAEVRDGVTAARSQAAAASRRAALEALVQQLRTIRDRGPLSGPDRTVVQRWADAFGQESGRAHAEWHRILRMTDDSDVRNFVAAVRAPPTL